MRGSFLRDIALFLVNSELDYLFNKFSMLFFLSLCFVIYFLCAMCVCFVGAVVKSGAGDRRGKGVRLIHLFIWRNVKRDFGSQMDIYVAVRIWRSDWCKLNCRV